MASVPQICGLLPPPARTDALAAVAKTIGLIRRRYALNAKEIAQTLTTKDGTAPIADTIERAERGENMLGFDLIAQLAFIYRECADPIRALLEPSATGEPTTVEERLQHAEQLILTVRRELKAGEEAS